MDHTNLFQLDKADHIYSILLWEYLFILLFVHMDKTVALVFFPPLRHHFLSTTYV